jgi:PAS domain S-box-containing protein
MTLIQTTYFISMIITAVIMSGISYYSHRNRNVVAGASVYMWISCLLGLMAFFEILMMLSPSESLALFWFNLRFISFASMPVLWIVFVFHYSGKPEFISRRTVILLFIIPAITQIMIWTNGLHGLWIIKDVGFYRAGYFLITDTTVRVTGVWYKVHLLYTYTLMLAGIILLLVTSVRMYSRQRGQAVMLGIGTLIMIIGSLFPSFNLVPGMKLYPMPQSFGLGSMIIAWGMYRKKFLIEQAVIDKEKKLPVSLILLFFLMTTGIITAGSVNYRLYRKHYRIEAERQLATIAELKVSDLVQWKNERISDGNILSGNSAFNNLVKRYFSDASDISAKIQIKEWLNIIKTSHQYRQIYLTDRYGKLIMSIPQQPEIENEDPTRYLNEARLAGGVILTDFHRMSPDKPIHLSVIVPIIYEYELKAITGFVVLVIDPEVYLYPHLKRWPVPSESAETMLVRRDSDDVLFLNELRFRKNTALNLRVSLANTQKTAVMAALCHEGVVEGIDYRGVNVLAVLRSVSGTQWHMVAEVDIDEIYKPVKERFWMMLFVIVGFIGAGAAGVGLIWRKRSERFYREKYEVAVQLRESESRYKVLVENIPQKIFMKSRDYRWISVNENLARDLGISQEEVAGKTDSDFFPKELADKYHADDVRIIQTGKTEEFEEKYAVAGIETWVNTVKTPVKDKNGEIIGILGIFWDISDRKKTENELKYLIKELARSNNELQQFAYVASHDLQEPLRMISSYLQLIERRYKDKLDSDANDFINFAVEGANRLQSLIVGLLEYSRVNSMGKPFIKINLRDILEAVLKDLELQIQDTKTVIEIGEMPVITGDEIQISRLFQNLIQNGIKFRREGVKPEIKISCKKTNTEYIFCVRDNGIGIEKEYFEMIFIIFQRLHTRDKYPGTGIGLSICQKIVERHGGKIWIESKFGEGSSFYFTIPIRSAG